MLEVNTDYNQRRSNMYLWQVLVLPGIELSWVGTKTDTEILEMVDTAGEEAVLVCGQVRTIEIHQIIPLGQFEFDQLEPIILKIGQNCNLEDTPTWCVNTRLFLNALLCGEEMYRKYALAAIN